MEANDFAISKKDIITTGLAFSRKLFKADSSFWVSSTTERRQSFLRLRRVILALALSPFASFGGGRLFRGAGGISASIGGGRLVRAGVSSAPFSGRLPCTFLRFALRALRSITPLV